MDLVAEAGALRRELTARHHTLYQDGRPLPGTYEERLSIRRARAAAHKRLIRRLLRRWFAQRGGVL